MAGLRKLKDKYYSRIWYRNDQGKRKEKLIPLNTKSKRRAKGLNKEIEKQERAFKSGVISLEKIEPKKVTDLEKIIDEFYKYLKINDRSQETIDLYRLALETFSEIYSDRDISLLGRQDYTEFLSKMRDRYPNKNTCNIRLTNIKSFLNWCQETGKIKQVPFKIKKLPVKNTKPRYFTDNMMNQILDNAKSEKELHARIYVHWKTGMRLSEIANSYLEGDYIKIHTAIKNGFERSIPVDQETKEYYQVAKKQTYRNDTYSKKFLRIIKDLGFYRTKSGDKRTFHCLRHTFAVRKYFETRDIYYVKKLLGHSTVKTTEIYAEFNINELDRDFNIEPKNGRNQKYVNPNNDRKSLRREIRGAKNSQDLQNAGFYGLS